ncbi:MAG: sensor histidine kinase [Brevundimonas sp.]
MRLGLGGRLTLTLVIALVAVQTFGLVVALRLRGPEGEAWRPPMPDRIAATADLLDRLDASGRSSVLIALNGDQTRFAIHHGRPAEYRLYSGPVSPLHTAYRYELAERDLEVLAPAVRRQWRPREAHVNAPLAFSVSLRDGQRLIVSPGISQRRRSLTMLFLWFSLAMTALSGILTWRIVKLATGQFEAIARAAATFSTDLSAPPMAEKGPQEARRVASAFNRMRAELKALIEERLRILAAVAHDLRTQLTRLRLRATYITNDDQRARADRDISEMATLIDDVLLVARGETRPPFLTAVDVRGLVESLVETRRELGDPISLESAEPAWARADPGLLGRVLDNLITNAVLHAGGGVVRVGSDPEGRIRISVIDHGPGLPENFLDVAFEPFTRQDTSRSRATGGSGLGLSIARSLARQMKGDVELAPTPGGGLTASIWLERR